MVFSPNVLVIEDWNQEPLTGFFTNCLRHFIGFRRAQ
jgi:hypothetical protein